jgi:3-hexulose-6-phosphate synthase
MKLQLALDGTLDEANTLLEAVWPYIDIAEVGTPLIFREGMHAVRALRTSYPSLTLLADLKIMDAGYDEAAIAFEAGANRVTALGVANDNTLRGAVKAAKEYGGQVMVDMMAVSDPVSRARQLLAVDAHLLCVHTAYDLQDGSTNPLAPLARLREALPDAPLAVAGGIGPDLLGALLPHVPQVIVVGGAITKGASPRMIAQTMRQQIDEVTT